MHDCDGYDKWSAWKSHVSFSTTEKQKEHEDQSLIVCVIFPALWALHYLLLLWLFGLIPLVLIFDSEWFENPSIYNL